MIIDTHCHLDTYENIDEIISEFDGIMITSGYDDKSNLKVLELVNKYPNVYGTLGIHPEEANNNYDLNIILNNINNKKIVAIGEIGLDYYYTKDNIKEQEELLKKQLDIAKKYNKPVVIHSRDAIMDTYNILSKYDLKGVIHCFSGSTEMAFKFIELGYKLGIGGVITFKNGKKLREVVNNINISDILLETDSPYITPEPFRGKVNKPKNVYYVAKKLSELKNVEIDDIISKTNKNAIQIFDISI